MAIRVIVMMMASIPKTIRISMRVKPEISKPFLEVPPGFMCILAFKFIIFLK